MEADDFMVTPSNAEAWRWVVETPPRSWPGHVLVLYGPEGCGKTHLLNIWRTQQVAGIVERHEAFLRDILQNATRFPALVLDNAESCAGVDADEVWLQHLYNATQETRTPLLLTARRNPNLWGLKLADIRSRLAASMAVALGEPDDGLLAGLLVKQFADRQLRVEREVIDYIVSRISRSGRFVRDLVERLDQAALDQNRKIGLTLVREVLSAPKYRTQLDKALK